MTYISHPPTFVLFLTTHNFYLELKLLSTLYLKHNYFFSFLFFYNRNWTGTVATHHILPLCVCVIGDVLETKFFTQPKFQRPQIKGKFALTRALLQPKIRWSLISLGSKKKQLIALGSTGCKGFIQIIGLAIWISG